ncbi:hypothetical protein NDU88_003166 [Pleurodeles waltl]|uniref:Uncharacterized protein n=1 Tax=Pleurodeles waltl TaxID=8319 RepID=A0AAV7W4V2_PLEWA|nr:hypothetical protein NDU88_003166 [Pleurodeles waltl]
MTYVSKPICDGPTRGSPYTKPTGADAAPSAPVLPVEESNQLSRPTLKEGPGTRNAGPDAMKNWQSREGGRATEEQRTEAMTEGVAKPDGNKKTWRRRVAERTSRRPRRRNVNPSQPRFRRSVALSGAFT